ncbi:amphiregulin [Hyperolius riggenbachi]|uniref:amphiregulin n=1 Tax=Hyperolius riggenbachi TaxID=752182 RepID=UPI0035A26C2C
MASHHRGTQHSLLSSHMARLLIWATLLLSIVCRCGVHCAVLTTPVPEVNVTALGEGGGILDDATDITEVSHDEEEEEDYSEDEEYEDHIPMKSFIIDDDSILVQPVIKPENTGASTGTSTGTAGKKGEKKNGEKKKKKGQNNKNKNNKKNKKKNPCQTTHTDYCIHGECRYMAALQEVSCKCQPDYFGERCSDRSMKSGTEKLSDLTTTTVLAVVAVLLSTISIAAIIIIIVVHTRRKYASYHCEAEEKKKLEQENGSDEVDV